MLSRLKIGLDVVHTTGNLSSRPNAVILLHGRLSVSILDSKLYG